MNQKIVHLKQQIVLYLSNDDTKQTINELD